MSFSTPSKKWVLLSAIIVARVWDIVHCTTTGDWWGSRPEVRGPNLAGRSRSAPLSCHVGIKPDARCSLVNEWPGTRGRLRSFNGGSLHVTYVTAGVTAVVIRICLPNAWEFLGISLSHRTRGWPTRYLGDESDLNLGREDWPHILSISLEFKVKNIELVNIITTLSP